MNNPTRVVVKAKHFDPRIDREKKIVRLFSMTAKERPPTSG
jgi:hypothetical protein